MSAARRKGTAAESAVVGWLRDNGWPSAERRALAGSFDRGDVAGVPGCVLEVKAEKAWNMAGWMKELAAEVSNDSADHGLLVVKRRMFTSPGDWYAVTTLGEWARLMQRGAL